MTRLVPIGDDVVRHIADDRNPQRLYRVRALRQRPAIGGWVVDLEALVKTGSFDGGPAAAELCVVESTSWVDRLLLAMLFVAFAAEMVRERHHQRRLIDLRLQSIANAFDLGDIDLDEEGRAA